MDSTIITSPTLKTGTDQFREQINTMEWVRSRCPFVFGGDVSRMAMDIDPAIINLTLPQKKVPFTVFVIIQITMKEMPTSNSGNSD
ncbi:MAG: hypothetical protein ABI171_21500 [Collimonas sp.]|uniref:hypothetical protein n=1 Tax=Collimonas sp. TaxID=1963772 RepID=UPI003267CA89